MKTNETRIGRRVIAITMIVVAASFGAMAVGCRSEPEPVTGEATGKPADDQGEGDEHGHEEGEGGEEAHDDTIRLTEQGLAEHGVSLAAAAPGAIDAAIELSGVIRPNGERLAHIVPRFPGVVREVRRTIGNSVKAGDVLAVVESSGSLSRYELKTMIDGLVIERHVTLGEAVDTENQLFVIADLGDVWADLSAFQKDLSRIRVGQTVRISAQHFAEGQSEVETKITYVTPVVDEATRTATVRAVLPNPAGSWRPGMFVTGKVLELAEARVAVPEAALQTLEGRSVVFVATEGGLKARRVTVGRRGETTAEIVSGLEPGERYAAAGTFLLKAELGKGAAEHDH